MASCAPVNWPGSKGVAGGSGETAGSSFGGVAASAFRFGIIDASSLRATLRALETTGDVSVLSSPRIATEDNREASILIGEHFPIVQETIQPLGGGSNIRPITLDHYEDIGIHLIVIPQLLPDNLVSMIIHPSVSREGVALFGSSTACGGIDADDAGGSLQRVSSITEATFPRSSTREAPTQGTGWDGDAGAAEPIETTVNGRS